MIPATLSNSEFKKKSAVEQEYTLYDHVIQCPLSLYPITTMQTKLSKAVNWSKHQVQIK
jgi:hypothetical protein